MTFEEIVIKFLEYAERQWPERRNQPERFHDRFVRWFDFFTTQPQPGTPNRHDCHQLCESLDEHFNDEDLSLVFLQCVEVRGYVEENAEQHNFIQLPAEESLLKDVRSYLEKKGISSWSDDSGAFGIFPLKGSSGVAEDVMRVFAIVVPLEGTLGTRGIYPANFSPDEDCQKALERAFEASRYIVSSRRTFWPAILFIFAGGCFPWSLLRVVLRLITCAISALRGPPKSWEELLQNSKVYIAVTGARMGKIEGPSIALAACLAILDALHRIPKAQKPPFLPIQIERLIDDNVQRINRAFTGDLTDRRQIGKVGAIGNKLAGAHRHKKIREVVLPGGNYGEVIAELTNKNVAIKFSDYYPRRGYFRIHTRGQKHLGFFNLSILQDKLARVWNWRWTFGNPIIVGIVITLIIVLLPYVHPPIPVITGGNISPVTMTGPVQIKIIGDSLLAEEVPINVWTHVALRIERNGYKGPLFIEVSPIPQHGVVNSKSLDFGKTSERVPVSGREAIFFYRLLDQIDSIGLKILNEEEKSVKQMSLIVYGKN